MMTDDSKTWKPFSTRPLSQSVMVRMGGGKAVGLVLDAQSPTL